VKVSVSVGDEVDGDNVVAGVADSEGSLVGLGSGDEEPPQAVETVRRRRRATA
jgi:hypothetical protein